jgi:hypothetical protein
MLCLECGAEMRLVKVTKDMCWDTTISSPNRRKSQEARIKQEQRAGVIDQL